MKRILKWTFGALLALLPAMASPPRATAQGPQGVGAGTGDDSPTPVINAVFSSQSTFERGTQTISPEFDPVLLVPIGQKLLFESKMGIGTNLTHDQAQWGPAVVNHGFKYLELDYLAHPDLMITVGRFLTPFGIYRERISPLWIRNLQQDPIIYVMNDNSSDGAMVHGAIDINPSLDLTYSAYYSVPTSQKLMESNRQTGVHTSLFFPHKRFDVGISFNHNMSVGYDMFGVDATWNIRWIPLDLRAEGLHNAKLGDGYWVEGAYRLNRLGKNLFLRKSQVVARIEQYMAPGIPQVFLTNLPDRDTRRITLGWNYYLMDEIRVDTSFGRSFALAEDRNTWEVGLTYRLTTF